ncbi:MAG: hypothetical protein RLZZ399_2244 [Verrucomicrobiota bacterium]
MIRRSLLLALALVTVAPTRAQDPAAASAQPPSAEGSSSSPSAAAAPKRDAKSLQKLLQELTPEQRQRLIENLRTWKQLSPDQKQALRERDGLLKKRAEEEAGALANELSEDQKDVFQKRYIEERLKLEMVLRQEFDTRRKAEIRELVERLRRELSQSPQKPPGESPKAP